MNSRYRKLPEGPRRLIFVLSFVVPLLIMVALLSQEAAQGMADGAWMGVPLLGAALWGMYWLVIYVVLWIREGYT